MLSGLPSDAGGDFVKPEGAPSRVDSRRQQSSTWGGAARIRFRRNSPGYHRPILGPLIRGAGGAGAGWG